MNITNHFKELSNFINENYKILSYDYNYFLEAAGEITDYTKDISDYYSIDRFVVGCDSSKTSLRIICPTNRLAKDIRILAIGMMKDSIVEVENGVITSIDFKVICKNNIVEIYVWNRYDDQVFENKVNSYLTSGIARKKNMDWVNEAKLTYNKKKSQNLEKFNKKAKGSTPSKTIEVNLLEMSKLFSDDNKSNSDKDSLIYQVFDLLIVFIGWTRGQWICRWHTDWVEFNDNRKPEVDKFKRYFHVFSKYKQNTNGVTKYIDRKYKTDFWLKKRIK